MFEGWPPPVLDPAGPYATSVSLLSWILFCMAAAVLAIVLAALYVALFGRPAMQAKIGGKTAIRSEEHTSELQSLMRISYAVFCLKKKNKTDITAQNRRETANT